MNFSGYREVLALPVVRTVLLLSLLIRIPVFAASIVLTLHVVVTLHDSYALAGLVTSVSLLAIAVAGPWRGRLLDRIGLRRTLLPSLVVEAACWSVAPFLSYWPLAVLATVAGLFAVPSFQVVRQVLVASVDGERRRTALALDSSLTEVAYMIGPLVGVWAATAYDTRISLFVLQWLSVLGAVALWVVNPPLRAPEPSEQGAGRRRWLSSAAVAVLLVSATTTFVLAGTDVGIVAGLRALGHSSAIGWVLTLWGLGSFLGGLGYGAWHRSISAFVLVGALGAVTVPVAAATGLPAFAGLVVLAGVLCAPAITATVDALSRVVPVSARGEALGWHSTAFTVGNAVGAPVAGFLIDRYDWQSAFAVIGGMAVVVAAVGLLAGRLRRQGRRGRPRAGAGGSPGASGQDPSPAGGGPGPVGRGPAQPDLVS